MEEDPLEAISAEAWPPSSEESGQLDDDEEHEHTVHDHDR